MKRGGGSKEKRTTSGGAYVTDSITMNNPVENARCSIYLKVACPFQKNSQTLECFDLQCPRQVTES